MDAKERRNGYFLAGFWHAVGATLGVVITIGGLSIAARTVRALINGVTYLWGAL